MSTSLDSSQRFAASEFRYLLDYFDARGYRVVDCLVQNRERQRLSVSFRYDVHLRDVHCAHGFLAVHRERSVAGTFFLLHDYSVPERAHEAELKALATLIHEAKAAGAPVALGLHDSPVDRYLQWRFAGGKEGEYIKWLSSAAGVAFFTELAQSPPATQDFHAAVTERFVQTVVAAKAALGDFELSAGHGGKLSQILRKRLPELGDAAALVEQCFAEHWMTPERLAAAGIVGDVERFKRQVPEVAVITEGGGRLRIMCERLQYYAAAARPMIALIHPASWGKSVRDAEWSQLLQLPTPPKLRLAVSVSPQQLLKDFANVASEEPFDLAVCTENAKVAQELAAELEARVVGTLSFIELIGSARHPGSTYDPMFGAGLRRYGDFVGATVAAAVGAEPDAALEMTPELSRRAHAFARWLEHEALDAERAQLFSVLFVAASPGHGSRSGDLRAPAVDAWNRPTCRPRGGHRLHSVGLGPVGADRFRDVLGGEATVHRGGTFAVGGVGHGLAHPVPGCVGR